MEADLKICFRTSYLMQEHKEHNHGPKYEQNADRNLLVNSTVHLVYKATTRSFYVNTIRL